MRRRPCRLSKLLPKSLLPKSLLQKSLLQKKLRRKNRLRLKQRTLKLRILAHHLLRHLQQKLKPQKRQWKLRKRKRLQQTAPTPWKKLTPWTKRLHLKRQKKQHLLPNRVYQPRRVACHG
jgi:hypothetical protein